MNGGTGDESRAEERKPPEERSQAWGRRRPGDLKTTDDLSSTEDDFGTTWRRPGRPEDNQDNLGTTPEWPEVYKKTFWARHCHYCRVVATSWELQGEEPRRTTNLQIWSSKAWDHQQQGVFPQGECQSTVILFWPDKSRPFKWTSDCYWMTADWLLLRPWPTAFLQFPVTLLKKTCLDELCWFSRLEQRAVCNKIYLIINQTILLLYYSYCTTHLYLSAWLNLHLNRPQYT